MTELRIAAGSISSLARRSSLPEARSTNATELSDFPSSTVCPRAPKQRKCTPASDRVATRPATPPRSSQARIGP